MPDDVRIHHRFLPHWRLDSAVYFVTWRLEKDQAALSVIERDRVATTLRHFDGTRYELLAYVVMDDHVHVLVKPAAMFPLERIVHSWKSYSGRNMHDGQRAGRVWQREYYDRIVRDEVEFADSLAYILDNPGRRWQGVGEYPWVWCRADLIE
jgi:putative transposase